MKPGGDERAKGYLLLLLLVSLLYLLRSVGDRPGPRQYPGGDDQFVLIEGDIERPGLYAFRQGTALKDLIERAGGLCLSGQAPDSFRDVPLSSGAKVVVRRQGGGWECLQEEMSGFHKFTLGIPISLNHESEEGLTAIPGIGPELGKTIVQERTRRGGFKSLNEIMDVKGIGTQLFAKISPSLTL